MEVVDGWVRPVSQSKDTDVAQQGIGTGVVLDLKLRLQKGKTDKSAWFGTMMESELTRARRPATGSQRCYAQTMQLTSVWTVMVG